MKRYTYSIPTDVPATILYRALTDIERWPIWDSEIESIHHAGKLTPGTRFTLKPKGGPHIAMRIVEATEPTRFVDLARLPLAKMRTSHVFASHPDGGTTIDICIEIFGPLGFLWDRLVARKQAAGLAEHTQAFVSFARSAAG